VDTSPKMVERASGRFADAGVKFSVCGAKPPLDFADETFDAIVSSSVVEYVPSIRQHLRELHRVCKHAGCLVVTVPNMAHPIRWVESFERSLAPYLGSTLVPYLRKRREYLSLSINRLRESEWKRQLAEAGWSLQNRGDYVGPLRLLVARKVDHVAAGD